MKHAALLAAIVILGSACAARQPAPSSSTLSPSPSASRMPDVPAATPAPVTSTPLPTALVRSVEECPTPHLEVVLASAGAVGRYSQSLLIRSECDLVGLRARISFSDDPKTGTTACLPVRQVEPDRFMTVPREFGVPTSDGWSPITCDLSTPWSGSGVSGWQFDPAGSGPVGVTALEYTYSAQAFVRDGVFHGTPGMFTLSWSWRGGTAQSVLLGAPSGPQPPLFELAEPAGGRRYALPSAPSR